MIPKGLPTPSKVRLLQRALYVRAKASPNRRAWSLYGELCRREVLAEALKKVISNDGAPGEDGVKVKAVKADANVFLDGLLKELKERSYRPGPVLRVWIPKEHDPDTERPIGIATRVLDANRESFRCMDGTPTSPTIAYTEAMAYGKYQ